MTVHLHWANVGAKVRDRLVGLSRSNKKLIVVSSDMLGLAACACGAKWLLLGTVSFDVASILSCLVVASIATLLAWSLGLYHSVVRFVGTELVEAAAKTSLGASLIGAFVMSGIGIAVHPARWFVLFSVLSFLYMAGSRFVARLFLVRQRSSKNRDRIIIYGAGQSGSQVAASLLGSNDYIPVAIVDDDATLHGTVVTGLRVWPPLAMDELICDTDANKVLLAIPSATRRKRGRILKFLADFPVHVQTLPVLADIVSGKAKVDELREVAVEDLLGRDAVPPDPALLGGTVAERSVMITGAGGSIGSELCRQIVRQNPETLVLFEISEYSLYAIEREVREIVVQNNLDCNVIPLLGSVHHGNRVREILETFDVRTIYHAAAYKHVPIVEQNILEGVHNNVIGTWNLAQAAVNAGVENFVLISTDKAVSPTNVMGATKRMAELILQALQDEFDGINFSMVRFGNVLESSGSVVPLFRKQIRAGGPVTVTHREIIRYFMTIPEAAQLVLQAASMAKGGDVFVLDMGEPVRILELAKKMIHLMGLTIRDDDNPDGDIEIQFTGLRPAEKLYEELLIGNDVAGTDHPRIMRAREGKLPVETIYSLIDEFMAASESLDRQVARDILLRAVSEYAPKGGVQDLVTVSQPAADAEESAGANVVGFPTGSAESA